MKKKHINIPVFIPQLACPFQCIYCNQKKISGRLHIPSPNEIVHKIESYQDTMSVDVSEIEIAFFGGNFTGLTLDEQERYLKLVQPYIHRGEIAGIRLSTRPDYITPKIIELLKKYRVTTIELGAQSMHDEVLKLSKRGHTAKDTENASKMILDQGFSLGLQMMIGLPGDSMNRSLFTANKIIELGADFTRIYPTLVIKGTKLEELFYQKKYIPLDLDQAITWCKELIKVFEATHVDIIKMGLHPSDGLITGKDLIAGPYHPSFRELVLSGLWRDQLEPLTKEGGEKIEICVAPDQLNYAVGYNSTNKILLAKSFNKVKYITGSNLKRRNFKVHIN